MYKIDVKDYGYDLTFSGMIEKEEMENWVKDSEKTLGSKSDFGVYVDMIELKPLNPEVQEVMEKGQKLYKQAGMKRSAVVVANALTKIQFKRIAKETGIYEWERYIDASENSNYKEIALAWIKDGKDPD